MGENYKPIRMKTEMDPDISPTSGIEGAGQEMIGNDSLYSKNLRGKVDLRPVMVEMSVAGIAGIVTRPVGSTDISNPMIKKAFPNSITNDDVYNRGKEKKYRKVKADVEGVVVEGAKPGSGPKNDALPELTPEQRKVQSNTANLARELDRSYKKVKLPVSDFTDKQRQIFTKKGGKK